MPKFRAALYILLIILSPSTTWAAALDLVQSFVKVNGASGCAIRTWEGEGKYYAFVISAQHVTSKLPDQSKVPADFFTFKNGGEVVESIRLFGRVLQSNSELDYAIIYYVTPHLYPACKNPKLSHQLALGDEVWAAGSPNRMLYWLSKGNISALIVGGLLHHYGHSAGTYFGSSGGPLFNKDGELVGLNVRLSSGKNDESLTMLGFMVPLSKVYQDLGAKKVRYYFNV